MRYPVYGWRSGRAPKSENALGKWKPTARGRLSRATQWVRRETAERAYFWIFIRAPPTPANINLPACKVRAVSVYPTRRWRACARARTRGKRTRRVLCTFPFATSRRYAESRWKSVRMSTSIRESSVVKQRFVCCVTHLAFDLGVITLTFIVVLIFLYLLIFLSLSLMGCDPYATLNVWSKTRQIWDKIDIHPNWNFGSMWVAKLAK